MGEPPRHDPARFCEQGQQAPKGGVDMPAKNEGHDRAGARIFHPSQPALFPLTAQKRPYFIGAQAQIGRGGNGNGPHQRPLVYGISFF